MKRAIVLSVCECQAKLGAELDESRRVIRGWAVDRKKKVDLRAPAHSIGPDRPQFQIGWACPICTRNTLRSFEVAGLAFRETSAT